MSTPANVNDTLPDGQNAVIVAARSGHENFAQFLVAHGSLIDEGCHDRRCLFHVIALNAIEHILV